MASFRFHPVGQHIANLGRAAAERENGEQRQPCIPIPVHGQALSRSMRPWCARPRHCEARTRSLSSARPGYGERGAQLESRCRLGWRGAAFRSWPNDHRAKADRKIGVGHVSLARSADFSLGSAIDSPRLAPARTDPPFPTNTIRPRRSLCSNERHPTYRFSVSTYPRAKSARHIFACCVSRPIISSPLSSRVARSRLCWHGRC
jgi:hypothetical protein